MAAEATRPACDACGRPADYLNRADGLSQPHVCEECAAVEFGDREGSRFAVAEVVIAVATMAHGYGLSAADLHTCVDEAVEAVNDDQLIACDVPWLDSLAGVRRAARAWLRGLQPIAEAGR
jgi:hypothetical protein